MSQNFFIIKLQYFLKPFFKKIQYSIMYLFQKHVNNILENFVSGKELKPISPPHINHEINRVNNLP